MSTYAILGVTGNIGSTILEQLLESSDSQVKAYCRSKQKLFKKFPEIETSKRVQVFEGSLNDTALLTDCLRSTRAVFLAVAVTGNQPGCSIAQDTAKAVVSALERLKEKNERLPKLIVLSSCGTDDRLMSSVPKLILTMLHWAFSNVYADLEKAETYLRSKDGLVTVTFIKPGAFSRDDKKEHELSLEDSRSPVTISAVAAGMIEVAAEDGERWDMKGVTVNNVSRKVGFPTDAPGMLARGLICHFFPWAYLWLG